MSGGARLRPAEAARAFEKRYGDGGSVELDAIHPDTLRELVTTAIEVHMPRQQLQVLRVVEAEERQGLELLACQVAKRRPAP